MSKKALSGRKKIGLLLVLILAALIYVAIFILYRNKIHDLSRFFGKIEQIYSAYGYYLIFFGAMIEATFILGFYIPGSFIVLLGVSLARLGITSFPLVILFGTLGFSSGYLFNYYLGRFGWYHIIESFGFEKQINEAKANLHRHYNVALFWGYMMSNTGSMLSTASGILKVPFKEFALKTMLIQLFWSLALGGLAFIFGLTFIKMFVVYFGTIAFISMILFLLNNAYKRKTQQKAKSA